MTQEQKTLILKDISSRLPYNPMVEYKGETYNVLGITCERLILCKPFMSCALNEYPLVEEVKLYLYPLSSISEEQALELYKLFGIKLTDSIGWDYIKINEVTGITFFLRKGFDVETHLDKLIDWLLKNHFDFRGLIPKGLAEDATGLNIY